MRYNWQQEDWPVFTFDSTAFEDKLHRYAEKAAFLTLPVVAESGDGN